MATRDMKRFATGAIREEKGGKGRYDLISPVFERVLAAVLEDGAAIHGDRNWEKGLPLSSLLDSLRRHLNQILLGEDDEDHLGHFAWNAMAFVHMVCMVRSGALPPGVDDLGVVVSRSKSGGPVGDEPEETGCEDSGRRYGPDDDDDDDDELLSDNFDEIPF